MPNNDFNRRKQGKNYTKDTVVTYLYTQKLSTAIQVQTSLKASFVSWSGYEAKPG